MIPIREALTKENILSKISSYAIFSYYSDFFIGVGRHFNSDFREDNNPSCCVAQIKGDLLYTDFGTGKSYRCVDFVMAKLGLSFIDALQQINLDFNLGLGCTIDFKPDRIARPEVLASKPKFKEKLPTIIKIKRRNWKQHDREYWYGKYFISKETLNLFDVVPISHFWINDRMFAADKHAYCYNFYWKEDNSIFYRKIYQPYNKRAKWISNGGKSYQGEGVLPQRGKLLIITKALKDVMVLYNFGYTAVAPPTEGLFLDEHYLQKQSSRFDKLILLYDNDNTGITKAKSFSEKYNISYVYIPEEYYSIGIKDISDFVEKEGEKNTKVLLNKLLNI